MRILITGGAGFVGSNLALRFRQQPGGPEVIVLDNLIRKGSELNVPDLEKAGVKFLHGDVRRMQDLEKVQGDLDLLIEASAEPSVLSGLNGSPNYLIETNLNGCVNCLELSRKRGGAFVFLSTSRVYSIPALGAIPLHEGATRLGPQSPFAVSESFSTAGHRSLYGSSKLAAELMIQEYAALHRIPTVINRCGVIAGPRQFGKVDQGVFTLWVANHYFKQPLSYRGFGGTGKQVRDLLHPADLFELILRQLRDLKPGSCETYNVGGGEKASVSLAELTDLCIKLTGNTVPISSMPETSPVDIPWYVTDHSKVTRALGWSPRHTTSEIIADIHRWIVSDRERLTRIFAPDFAQITRKTA